MRSVLSGCVAGAIALAVLVPVVSAGTRGEKPAPNPAMTPPIDFTGQPLKTWVKRTPGPGAPVSPRLGYETSYGWDPARKTLIRWGGHNQGGGGEQNAETWHYDPVKNTWDWIEPNTSPPGNCCCRDNVFAPSIGRFVRFPAFFHSHGWQWRRTGYTRDSSVWQYDPGTQTWRNMRPLPRPWPRPMRGVAWDSDAQVILLAAGENAGHGTQVYDPYTNRWTAMNPKRELPGRNTFGLAYDSKRKCFYAFGDQYGRDQRTWKYDYKSNTWTDLKPPHHPAKAGDGTVMAYDTANDVVVANLRQGTEKGQQGRRETWVYKPAENDWEKLDTGADVDYSGPRNTVMVYVPEWNVFFLENRTRGEQQIWTFRYDSAPEDQRPGPEFGWQVGTWVGGFILSWKPVAPRGIVVYRGTAEKPWGVTFEKVKTLTAAAISLLDSPAFGDKGLKRGTVYYYYLTTIDENGRESKPSVKVRTQPRVVEDVVVSPLASNRLELEWKAPGPDIAGYRVERADVQVYSMSELTVMEYGKRSGEKSTRLHTAIGAIRAMSPFKTITRELVKETKFVDTTIDFDAGQQPITGRSIYGRDMEKYRDPKGKPYPWAVYAYRIYAVNYLGVESGDSPWFLSVPGPVEHVFSREEVRTVHLKWAAHTSKGIVGYNVYRMWDRFGAKPIERLNEGPVKEPRFTDPKAARPTHRYFVAAVDALGQEGLISSPVWSYREWRRFYAPFEGEWHQ